MRVAGSMAVTRLLGQLLDAPLGEPVAEHLRDRAGHRDRALHREGRRHLHRVADAALREVLVQQEGSLERSRRALERLPEDRHQHPPAIEIGQRVAKPLGAGERVVLVPASLEARRGGQVVVGAERHDDEVGVVRACVGGDSPCGRVDAGHRLLAELDAVLREVAVVELHLLGRLTAEHHLKLGEAEEESVVAVDKRDANRVRDRLGEPRRELQATEAGAEDQDVLLHRTARYFTARSSRGRGSGRTGRAAGGYRATGMGRGALRGVVVQISRNGALTRLLIAYALLVSRSAASGSR